MIEVKRRERTSPRAAPGRGDKWDSTLIVRRSLSFCMLDKESHCCAGQCNAKQKRPRLSIFPFMDTTLAAPASIYPHQKYNKTHGCVSCYDVVLLDSSNSTMKSRPPGMYNCLGAIIPVVLCKYFVVESLGGERR